MEYSSRQRTAIEINGTRYGAQKPAIEGYASFADPTGDFIYARLTRNPAAAQALLARLGA